MSETVRFTARQKRYIEWLASTKYDRVPATREALAKEIGVSSRTLRRWYNKAGFQEAVDRRTRELLKEEFPEILGALRREAGKGSFQHIKLALELLGEYIPLTRQQSVNIDLSSLSDHDLQRIVDGEDPVHVLATAGRGGTGETRPEDD